MPCVPIPLITLSLMALSFRQTASISPISPFWNSAKETLRLGALRTQVKPIRPLPVDPILARPEFLPLCGNGRIDTKADYEAFYLAERRPPLSMTMQQMGVIMSPPTLETPFDPSTLFKLFNLTIFVDEECDDGNRIDFDGCSADCMNMDLWSTPCEIATDKHLVYEDIMYDPIRQVMMPALWMESTRCIPS